MQKSKIFVPQVMLGMLPLGEKDVWELEGLEQSKIFVPQVMLGMLPLGEKLWKDGRVMTNAWGAKTTWKP